MPASKLCTRVARRATIRLAAVAVAAAAISGCSWGPRYRDALPGETFELESFTVTLPPGKESPHGSGGVLDRVPAGEGQAWRATRYRDAGWRRLELWHSTNGAIDEVVVLSEADGIPPSTPDELRARARKGVAALLDDASARLTELAPPADPRFGASARQVLAIAEESDAKAGLLVKRVASAEMIEFAPPALAGRFCEIASIQTPRRGATAAELEERWRTLLAGVALRPVDREAVVRAAGGDFYKLMERGLARRSLTLPPASLQWRWARERWIAPSGADGSWRLAVGLTERLELGAPAFLRYAFGDPAALIGPEVAIGAGWSSWEHDAEHGSTWGGRLSLAARRRFGANAAARGEVAVDGKHESRTDRNRLGAVGAVGVVWDAHPLVSLGFEAGYAWQEDEDAAVDRVAWIGGQRTPVVTVHVPPVDLGLTGGLGWDGEDLGALVGFQLVVTF